MLGNETFGGPPVGGPDPARQRSTTRRSPDAQIKQNFNAGVGRQAPELRFDVRLGGPGAYVEFVVSELDDYSYLFCRARPGRSDLEPRRNPGCESANRGERPGHRLAGQAFVNLDRQLVTESRPSCSPGSAPIILQGSGARRRTSSALEFEDARRLRRPGRGGLRRRRCRRMPVVCGPAHGRSRAIRNFARINETMAELPRASPRTRSVVPAMPIVELTESAAGLATTCARSRRRTRSRSRSWHWSTATALVETPALASEPSSARRFDFDAAVPTAFANQTGERDLDHRQPWWTAQMLERSMSPTQPDPCERKWRQSSTRSSTTLTFRLHGGHLRTATDDARPWSRRTCAAVLASSAVTIH